MHAAFGIRTVLFLALAAVLSGAVFDGSAANPPADDKRLQFKIPPKSIVYDSAFSADGKLLAVACLQNEILIYETATGAQRSVILTKERVRSVAFAPDGKTLVSSHTNGEAYSRPKDPAEIKVWDLRTGNELASLRGQGACWKVAFTPDGKSVVSASGDSTVKIWDPATGMVKAVLTEHTGPVRTFAFSPDGKVLATGSFDGSVIFWDTTNFKKQRSFRPHPQAVQNIVFSPSGRRFATSEWPIKTMDKSEVKIWDFATGRALTQVQGIAKIILCLDFSADERMLIVGGGDKQNSAELKLIEVASGKARAVVPGHREWLECIRFSPDGQFFVGGGGYNQTALSE